jgi:hypothetical protein
MNLLFFQFAHKTETFFFKTNFTIVRDSCLSGEIRVPV